MLAGGGAGLGSSSAVGAVGLTSSGVQSGVTTTTTPTGGTSYNYQLVVQVPVPFLSLNLNLNLLADFILPALSVVKIPQAVEYFVSNAESIMQNIIDDATALIMAIPEASVTIVVKVGFAVVVNIQLIAERVPMKVPIPTFQLSLPSIAVDPKFNLVIPFPAPPPIVIKVPIPVPILPSLLKVKGGQVAVNASATVVPQPVPVTNPIYFPTI